MNELLDELEGDIRGCRWYGRNSEEVEDALKTLRAIRDLVKKEGT